jgi:crotonobetainyl-CoA:carnitine CoA-transferase CaiB-like acyl-CoA transferase
VAAHWLALLRSVGVPCGEIQDYGAVFADPHLRERGFFVDLLHSKLGTVRGLGTPLRLRSSPARLERAGPLLGEHSAEVLREIGHSEDEVRAFVARGTVTAA